MMISENAVSLINDFIRLMFFLYIWNITSIKYTIFFRRYFLLDLWMQLIQWFVLSWHCRNRQLIYSTWLRYQVLLKILHSTRKINYDLIRRSCYRICINSILCKTLIRRDIFQIIYVCNVLRWTGICRICCVLIILIIHKIILSWYLKLLRRWLLRLLLLLKLLLLDIIILKLIKLFSHNLCCPRCSTRRHL